MTSRSASLQYSITFNKNIQVASSKTNETLLPAKQPQPHQSQSQQQNQPKLQQKKQQQQAAGDIQNLNSQPKNRHTMAPPNVNNETHTPQSGAKDAQKVHFKVPIPPPTPVSTTIRSKQPLNLQKNLSRILEDEDKDRSSPDNFYSLPEALIKQKSTQQKQPTLLKSATSTSDNDWQSLSEAPIEPTKIQHTTADFTPLNFEINCLLTPPDSINQSGSKLSSAPSDKEATSKKQISSMKSTMSSMSDNDLYSLAGAPIEETKRNIATADLAPLNIDINYPLTPPDSANQSGSSLLQPSSKQTASRNKQQLSQSVILNQSEGKSTTTRIIQLKPHLKPYILNKFLEWRNIVARFRSAGNKLSITKYGEIEIKGSEDELAMFQADARMLFDLIKYEKINLFKDHSTAFSRLEDDAERELKCCHLDFDSKILYYIEERARHAAYRFIYDRLNVHAIQYENQYVFGFLKKVSKFKELGLQLEEVSDMESIIAGDEAKAMQLLEYCKHETAYFEHKMPVELIECFEKSSLHHFLNQQRIYYKIIFDQGYKIGICGERARIEEDASVRATCENFFNDYENGVRVTQEDAEFVRLFYVDDELYEDFKHHFEKKKQAGHKQTCSLIPSTHVSDESDGLIFKSYAATIASPKSFFVDLVNNFLKQRKSVNHKAYNIARHELRFKLPSVFRQAKDIEILLALCKDEFRLNAFSYIFKHTNGRERVGKIPVMIDEFWISGDDEDEVCMGYFCRQSQVLNFENAFTNISSSYEIEVDENKADSAETIFNELRQIYFDYSIVAERKLESKTFRLKGFKANVLFAYCCFQVMMERNLESHVARS